MARLKPAVVTNLQTIKLLSTAETHESPLLVSGEHTLSKQRQRYKMKSRILFVAVFILLILGIVLSSFFTREQEPARIFPATVNRDCAPWDGPAFTVAVRYDTTTVIYVSIWKSPDIMFPSTFELADGERQIGDAYILPELGSYIPLRGEVWFQRVEEGMPIEGRFSFTSERGETYEGEFVAEWESQIAYCG